MNGQKRKTGLLVTLLVLVGGLAIVWSQRLAINDWLRLRDYAPPPSIAQLATATTMNDTGRRLFYVNHPQLSDRSSFSTICKNDGEKTIVLGCYITGQGIYVFDVTDERLAGVEEVTAAHEMLHAAYERLNDSERARIDKLTEQAYKASTNQRLKDNVESYRRKDPTIVPNELHSILGTEERNLPSELEAYYKKYLTDRLKVVAFAEAYEKSFTQREAKRVNLENQITSIRAEIDGVEAQLTTQKQQLEETRDSITNNDQVVAFNAKVQRYNASINYLNGLIDQHNGLVEQYKQVSLEETELFKALDSRPTVQ